MALGDPYIDGPALGDYMDEIDLTVEDSVRDSELADAAAAASRDINKVTGRDFNKADSPSPRIFIPKASTLVITDDFFTTTGLQIEVLLNNEVQGNALAANEYELFPLNGTVDGLPAPYTGFRIPYPNYRYLWGYNRIRVTAQWGWEEIPADIIQATKIRAAELFQLSKAPLGVISVGSGSANYTNKARPVPHWKQLALQHARTERKVFLG